MKEKYKDFDRLNRLMVACFRAEQYYYNAAQDAQTTDLKRFMNYMATERNRIANDISNQLSSRDIEPLELDVEKGNTDRTWNEIKEALENYDAVDMLAEGMARDKGIVTKISDMLKEEALPEPILEMLYKHRKKIQWYLKQAEQHKKNHFKDGNHKAAEAEVMSDASQEDDDDDNDARIIQMRAI